MKLLKNSSERGLIITVIGALLMLSLPTVTTPAISNITNTTLSIQSQIAKVNLSIDKKIFGNQGKNSNNPNNVARNFGLSSIVKTVTSAVQKVVAPVAAAVAKPITAVVQTAVKAVAVVATVAVKAVAVVATAAVKVAAVVVPAAAKALPAINNMANSATTAIANTSAAAQANVAAASSTIQAVVNTAMVGVLVGLAAAVVTVVAIALAPATAAISGATMALVVMAAVTAGTIGAVGCSVLGASPCSPASAPSDPIARDPAPSAPAAAKVVSNPTYDKVAQTIIADKGNAEPDTKPEVTAQPIKPLPTTILKLDPAVNTDKPTAQDKVIIGGKVTDITTLINNLTSQLSITTDQAERQIIIDQITALENAKTSFTAILAKKVVRPS